MFAVLECEERLFRVCLSILSSKHKLRLGMVTLREGGSLNKIKYSGNQLLRKLNSVRNGKDRAGKKINYCMAVNIAA